MPNDANRMSTDLSHLPTQLPWPQLRGMVRRAFAAEVPFDALLYELYWEPRHRIEAAYDEAVDDDYRRNGA